MRGGLSRGKIHAPWCWLFLAGVCFIPCRVVTVNRLQRLIEWYFEVPTAEPGQGTAWEIVARDTTAGVLPGGLVSLGVLGIAAIVWLYCRQGRSLSRGTRATLTALRVASLLLLLLMVSGLALSVQRTGLPYLVLMVDSSASMGSVDQYSSPTYAEPARRWLTEKKLPEASRLEIAKSVLLDSRASLLKTLGARYRLKAYTFDDTVAPLTSSGGDEPQLVEQALRELQPNGIETRPAPCLQKIYEEFRGATPAGIVLLTDGVASRSASERTSAAAEQANLQSIPIFSVGLGSSDPERDLELTDVLAERLAILGDPLLFSARVRRWGVKDEKVRATLRRVGEAEVLATAEVQPTTNPFSIELLTVPQVEGDQEYEIAIVPVTGESTVENNSLKSSVSVRRTKIRVLLVERAPRWEFRHLKPLLERDEMIDLKTVLQDSDIDFVQEDRTALAGYPTQQDELEKFDVVILGDVDLSFFNPQSFAHLRSFVAEQGGGLLLIAGEKHNPKSFLGTPLEVLCPVDLETLTLPAREVTLGLGFQLEPTPEGRTQTFLRLDDQMADPAALWRSLPDLHWAWNVGKCKPGAVTLAVQSNRFSDSGKMPVLVWQRFGAGQVLFHATDEMWQWRQGREDAVYGRYWGQVLRQLCRAKLLGAERILKLTSDRPVYTIGESVRLMARSRGGVGGEADSLVAIVERSGGERRRVTLERVGESGSQYEAVLPMEPVGQYQAWIESADSPSPTDPCRFRVEIPNRELRERAANHEDLRETARITHGKFYHWTEAGQLARELPEGRPVAETAAELIPLWKRWELVVLLLACLTAEWLIRKRARLA